MTDRSGNKLTAYPAGCQWDAGRFAAAGMGQPSRPPFDRVDGLGGPLAVVWSATRGQKVLRASPACFLSPVLLYWIHAYPDRRHCRRYPALLAAADVSRGESRRSGPRDQDRRRRDGARGRRLYRHQGRTRGRHPARDFWGGAIGLVAVRGVGVRQYRPDVRRLGHTALAGTDVTGSLAVSRHDAGARQRRALGPDRGRAIRRPFPW